MNREREKDNKAEEKGEKEEATPGSLDAYFLTSKTHRMEKKIPGGVNTTSH